MCVLVLQNLASEGTPKTNVVLGAGIVKPASKWFKLNSSVMTAIWRKGSKIYGNPAYQNQIDIIQYNTIPNF